MLNHMKSSHKSKLTEADKTTDEKQKITTFYTPSKAQVPKNEPVTEEGFQAKLISFIVHSNQPFRVVEDPHFSDLVNYLSRNNPKIKLPCAKTLRSWISNAYEKEKLKIKHLLTSNEGKISFIVDGWTSLNQKAFQGVIATWINADWELCQSTIDLTVLEGSHTGANLAAAFSALLDDYGLWPRILSITTDNAYNMDSFFKELEVIAEEKVTEFDPAKHRVRCLAHVLNLSCKEIVDCVMPKKKKPSAERLESELNPLEKECSENELDNEISSVCIVCIFFIHTVMLGRDLVI